MTFCAGLRPGLLSLAITVMGFAPGVSGIVRLQFAVPVPVAVSLSARTPLTITDEMPLSPKPLSVAVPDTMTVFLVKVSPSFGLIMTKSGAVVSAGG
jgi:hypothetical protein